MKPKPDSVEWWRQVAQGLSVEIHDLRIRTVHQTIDSLERGGWLSADDALHIRATLPANHKQAPR